MTPSAPSSFSKTRVVSMSGRVLVTVTRTPRIIRWSVIKRSFAALTASLHQPMVALLSAPRSAAVGCFLQPTRRRWAGELRTVCSPTPRPVDLAIPFGRGPLANERVAGAAQVHDHLFGAEVPDHVRRVAGDFQGDERPGRTVK